MSYGKKLTSTVVVPTASSLLTIDTRDSYKFKDGFIGPNYTNPYNIQIYKNESVFQGKITRLALQEFNMIYSIPNVNPYNSILFLNDGVNDAYISIPVGFLTPIELGNKVEDALNGVSTGATPAGPVFGCNTWVVKYIPEFASFEITNQGSIAPLPIITKVPFKILPKYGQDKGTSNVPGETTTYVRTDTLATMMGFGNVPDALSPVVAGIDTTGWRGDVASMLYTTYIDVVSQVLTSNQKVRDVSTNDKTGSNLLARIYIGNNFQPLDTMTKVYTPPSATNATSLEITNNTLEVKPFYINYQPPYVKQVRWDDSIFLSSVNIRLQDDKGNLLYDFERNLVGNNDGIGFSGSNGYAQITFLISESEE